VLVDAVEDWPWSTYHRVACNGLHRHRVLNDYDGDLGQAFCAA
jgi:hypothetical protein